jgi:hypothetical protein
MRILLATLLFFSANILQAQLYFPEGKIKLETESSFQEYMVAHHKSFQEIKELTAQLVSQRSTNHSLHYRYQVLFKQIPLFNNYITIHLNKNKEVLSMKYELEGIEALQFYNPLSDFEKWSHGHPEKLLQQQDFFYKNLKTSALNIFIQNQQAELVLVAQAYSKTYDQTWLMTYEGKIIEQYNNERRLFGDTIVQGKVFNPDPLTTLAQNYGGVYVDSNDIHQGWMNGAYQTKDIRANYSNGIFYLENNLVTLDEFENPVVAPVTQSNPSFLFNRNESGFEDCNVVYHITSFHDYISSLGYDSLLIDGILVDAHAQNGVDNSVFSRNGGNPTLRYGTGGVDDAEDADVIIHEYAHGLSWSANGNDNFNDARMGLDEGVADYFATSYSRSINVQDWQRVFSWDGHNEFWSGRVANTTDNYPQPAGMIYTTGEVWNTAMSNIWTDLGGIITDKLMLEAMYFFTNSTSLAEAAVYVLQADTILFAGQHSNTICTRFQQKNILDNNCKPVAIKNISTPISTYAVFNSQGFAEGTSDVTIQWKIPGSGSYTLVNSLGEIILQKAFERSNKVIVSPNGLASGMYQVVLRIGAKVEVIGLMRE